MGWMTPGAERPGGRPVDLRTDIPHSARIYDYLLGGKDNFAADRAAAAQITANFPRLPAAIRANRAYMVRVTRYLVRELGIRQFLDIGTGLPTSPNLHEAAQEIAPETRVVYADNDPIVLVHARALLTSTLEGKTAYLEADLNEPEAILDSAGLRATLDLDKPVGLTLLAILQTFGHEQGYDVVRRLTSRLAKGSVLAISVAPDPGDEEELNDGAAAIRSQGLALTTRTVEQTARFFDGMDILDPGVVRVSEWHPDHDTVDEGDSSHMYAAVGIKR